MNTPELDKIKAARADTQAAGDFLEWLDEQGIELSKWEGGLGWGVYEQIDETRESLLARWKGIDLAAAERERRALLDRITRTEGDR
jgi:hypothetical protein